MDHRIDLLGWRGLIFGWLCALVSLPLALVVAVVGQGLGALIGGCSWIGLAVPPDRQVWALVNQPTMGFADTSSAHGYWLGSLLLPVAVIIFFCVLLRSYRRLSVELFTIHASWGLTLICVAWLPLIDRQDGHLNRWLHYGDFSQHFIWALPLLAVCLGLFPGLRLLSLMRMWRRDGGRAARIMIVILHFSPAVIIWIGLTSVLGQSVAVVPAVAVGACLLAAVILAWLRYTHAPFHPMREIGLGGVVAVLMTGIVLGLLVWGAGRPLDQQKRAGLLWANRSTTNNIRQWIETRHVFGETRSTATE